MSKSKYSIEAELSYQSESFAHTDPRHLAAIARLFGMSPAPVDSCRVLELGCSAGNNIIPLAYRLRGSSFVGIDISLGHIDAGKALIRRLGLTNIKLTVDDFSNVGPDFGTFDYIIVHGVFSWVPKPLQESILKICSANLAREGVAYVSYNAFPGWHLRLAVRELLLFHTRHATSAKTKVVQARQLIEFLTKQMAEDSSHYLSALREQLLLLKGFPDWYLFHDILEEVNEPIYFSDFVSRAEHQGLQYLGDANISAMTPHDFSEDIQVLLRKISRNPVELEQYADFFRAEMFRRTLLCHREITLHRESCLERVPEFFFSACLGEVQGAEEGERKEVVRRYRGSNGIEVEADVPPIVATLGVLAKIWPESISFSELMLQIKNEVPVNKNESEKIDDREKELIEQVVLGLFKGYLSGVINFHTLANNCRRLNDAPMVSELVRIQAENSVQVTSELHFPVLLDEFSRRLVLLLDGSRNTNELENRLKELSEKGADVSIDNLKKALDGLSREGLLL